MSLSLCHHFHCHCAVAVVIVAVVVVVSPGEHRTDMLGHRKELSEGCCCCCMVVVMVVVVVVAVALLLLLCSSHPFGAHGDAGRQVQAGHLALPGMPQP